MEPRIIISGGGTGGHIFPAISIANAIKELRPEAEILFVGAEGRMEMQRVPDAGYKIIGLPVAGFDRKKLLNNFSVLVKLAKSLWMTREIIKDCGRRRICQRPYPEGCQQDGYSYLDTRAELFRRCNE